MNSLTVLLVVGLFLVLIVLLMYAQYRANKAEQELLKKEQELIVEHYNKDRIARLDVIKGAKENYEEAKQKIERILGIDLDDVAAKRDGSKGSGSGNSED